MSDLKSEISQSAPFSSVEEEAILNLMRTSDCLHRAFQHKSRRWGLTSTQYNVLRILRGALHEGLTCAAIGDRLITQDPDISRLLDRLKSLKLIRQHRGRSDRRMVWTQITDAGLDLLCSMDPVIQGFAVDLLGHMSSAELSEMIRLLEFARQRCAGTQAHE